MEHSLLSNKLAVDSAQKHSKASKEVELVSLRSTSLESTQSVNSVDTSMKKRLDANYCFVPSSPKKGKGKTTCLKQLFDTIETHLSSSKPQFTPSTPYVHKFRTEMCRNFELYGKCKYGDEVSYFLF